MVLPGFGNPIDKNTAFLVNNLELIKKTCDNAVIDVKIYCFVDEEVAIKSIEGVNIEVFYERGIIGEFLYRHITPDVVEPYDYVIISMDDMELMPNFNLSNFINEKRVDWEILSPCLTNDSKYTHEYMLKGENTGLYFYSHLELFFYVLTREGYLHYFDVFINDPKVNWLWSVDAIFGQKGIKSYINFDYQVRHHHVGASGNNNAVMECLYNRDKHIVPKCIIHLSEVEEPSWQKLNPEFKYVLLNMENTRKVIEAYFSEFLKRYDEDISRRRELVKNIVLYLEGGVFIEGDIKCIKPVDNLIKYMEITSRKDCKTSYGFDILIDDNIIISKKRRMYWKNRMIEKNVDNTERIERFDLSEYIKLQ